MPYNTQEMVVVTGTSSGIGRATAEKLAADGFHVLAGVRRQEDADKIKQKNIEPVILDVTAIDTLRALAERVEQDPLGRPLRAVVNNAGIAVNAPLEMVPLDEFRRQIEVSVIGQVAVIQALTPALLNSGGRVVNIGSVGGKISMPGFGIYSAAKYAMEAINDSLRREMSSFGLKVIMITPGGVSTSLSEKGVTTADRLSKLMTPDQHRRHDRLFDAVKAQAESWATDGIPPKKVAEVVSRAIHESKPRTRYTAGRDSALLTRLVRILPDKLLDRMLRSQMKLQ
ncbi:SDR family NAD(P)-dependent oxidoreductase [Paenibacillus polymyxa]|jgi:NAD(P)-dependent dehydrogenase (short-subunit alcohol dehydrogenase family)|uniref:SDR family NAD(P)-dependent oxidoreductase n=1 Tax=Paenibacillus TaxID=44249 RepID=UPI0005CEB440|nr:MULTISPECIES: SDR family NAD(P)-dependent oxidoreductase [Paenibacillus]KJD40513.1 dehydrogenase [Paenibacillus polymyxa]MBP1176495.1 NAD(P)-dependent dehydrogenase (short-subunit alcohol dehydrogenase family) [Paenibacillus sp. PvR133]MDN4079334.1 SDR family NAD(P)-dependent oxidoreductase [Paenibacillus polymyxa]MDN4104754.1 SDR family NAD(P)-dependent oxidoreductase [Paenibacillus polymyxa]MDN4115209.1 SDR family NAD(P)-dependent oxidoreductase [Paenibacillus polymyxa]